MDNLMDHSVIKQLKNDSNKHLKSKSGDSYNEEYQNVQVPKSLCIALQELKIHSRKAIKEQVAEAISEYVASRKGQLKNSTDN